RCCVLIRRNASPQKSLSKYLSSSPASSAAKDFQRNTHQLPKDYSQYYKNNLILVKKKMDIKEGTIIHSAKESYQLREFLDEGAFGTVMKGKKLETNEDVAIKIFKNNNKDILSLEFNALKRIQRIDADKYNLVKCIERFGYRRKVFIVFEMLDQSLHDFMRKRDGSPLSMSEIKTISWQLLVALKGLKSIGLVHTDIKPDNIMLVDSKSQPLRVKLIDFGLSLKLDDLITGSIFQTMPYRAPEVRLGLPLNEAIDMWALGHILTLLLTGSSLYPCDNDFNIIRAMVRMQGMPDRQKECADRRTLKFGKTLSEDVFFFFKTFHVSK
uniref:Protein kinase domain-containing protein n=1 Tax=Oryzias melastigma TaxID=30732 RepID=A0A3B3DUA1_ORYME